RLFGLQKGPPLAGQVKHLLVTVSILAFAARLAIAMQRVVQLLEQTADRLMTDLKLLPTEFFDQRPQRLADPLRTPDRIAGGGILQQLVQRCQESGLFFSKAGRPAPARRTPGVLSVWLISFSPARIVIRLRPVMV